MIRKFNKIGLLMSALAVSLMALISPSCVSLEGDMSMQPQDNVAALNNQIAWANAIVTVRTSSSGRDYFQFDLNTTLDPVGWRNPCSKEVRALVAYSELAQKSDFCTKSIRVEKIDSIVTSEAAYIDIGSGLPGGSEYPVFSTPVGYDNTTDMMNASSPVEIVGSGSEPDWMTFSEDGYLMVHFATFWGDITRHTVNLYALADHPDHLYLVHKDNGDLQTTWKESLVAFKICHLYPARKDGYDNPDEIVLHWLSFSGEKTVVLKYGNRATER